MAKKTVTLFIRDDKINLLVMNGGQVEKWASMPLEAGLISHGIISDEAKVAEKVKELFTLEKVATNKVLLGLGGYNSLYRTVVLPEVPDAILDEAVKREARRVIPVPLDEVYLSYQSIPGGKGERRIFLVAFPRNITDSLLNTLKKANIQPYAMDLAPLALSRIPNEPISIIVNVRLDHLEVMVISERIPQLVRWVSIAGEGEPISARMSTISEEFMRTVTFYNSSHMEKPLDSRMPLFVAGELTEAPDTWEMLTGRLGFPTSVLNASIKYPESFPVNDFMVNVGLALKEIQSDVNEGNFSIINLNALPEAYLPKATPMSKVLIPVGIVVAVGVLAYMGVLIQQTGANNNKLNSQLALIQKSITQQRLDINALKENIKLCGNQINQKTAQLADINVSTAVFANELASLKQGREEASQDLTQVVSLLPQYVTLTDVTFSHTEITVKGSAPAEENIFDYARRLRTGSGFSSVVITSIEAATPQGSTTQLYKFNFSIK